MSRSEYAMLPAGSDKWYQLVRKRNWWRGAHLDNVYDDRQDYNDFYNARDNYHNAQHVNFSLFGKNWYILADLVEISWTAAKTENYAR